MNIKVRIYKPEGRRNKKKETSPKTMMLRNCQIFAIFSSVRRESQDTRRALLKKEDYNNNSHNTVGPGKPSTHPTYYDLYPVNISRPRRRSKYLCR